VPFRPFPDFLLISQAAAAGFTVVRLLHFRMWRRFSFLYSYLAVTAVYDAALSVLSERSRPYLRIYLVGEAAIMVAAALAVREMYTLIFRDYPGLRTAGRWALYTALALSFTASLLMARAFWRDVDPRARGLFYELALERSVDIGLAVIILILMLFLSRYPLRLDRNTVVASAFFSTIFLAQAAVKLIDSASPRLIARYADYPEVGFTAICLLGWGMLLQPSDTPAPIRPAANKLRETELLQQLESINHILSRSGRR